MASVALAPKVVAALPRLLVLLMHHPLPEGPHQLRQALLGRSLQIVSQGPLLDRLCPEKIDLRGLL